ncbi:hypothetical protein LR48_Vigan02g070700 [Vigna angularis]|uniref:Uncharacterized protein n=1 Tax=Phaseolus angularis TaxID=3914 RepID=A0A0L9TVY2_PHAAN|nr:hypothetical protein LR48_Vigan02g070700 [Vigna angularis]
MSHTNCSSRSRSLKEKKFVHSSCVHSPCCTSCSPGRVIRSIGQTMEVRVQKKKRETGEWVAVDAKTKPLLELQTSHDDIDDTLHDVAAEFDHSHFGDSSLVNQLQSNPTDSLVNSKLSHINPESELSSAKAAMEVSQAVVGVLGNINWWSPSLKK